MPPLYLVFLDFVFMKKALQIKKRVYNENITPSHMG
jgi:hypothetical protein